MDDRQTGLLLLALLARDWERARELAAPLAGAPQAAMAFVEAGRVADVLPWLHALLAAEGRLDVVGPEVAAELAGVRRKTGRDNLLLIAVAQRALDALLAAGVTPLALKGLDLLHRIYPGIDARSVDDIDLLVRGSELRAALAALESAGFEVPAEPHRSRSIRSSHHLPLWSPGPQRVMVELHWNLVQDVRFDVDPEGLFARAAPLDVGGRGILRLGDDDVVAHLLVHHFTHYFARRLKWLVDLDLLAAAGTVHWDGVVRRVREWGATVSAGSALLHLARLSPRSIPAAALDALPVPAWRRALTVPLLSSHPLELYRGTRRRPVQLYLAAVMLERPALLPGWLVRRAVRNLRPGDNPLDVAQGAADDRAGKP